MPGHAHAAIAAMKARTHVTNDTTYLLSDPDDRSQYMFVDFLYLCSLNTVVRYLITSSIYVLTTNGRYLKQCVNTHSLARISITALAYVLVMDELITTGIVHVLL